MRCRSARRMISEFADGGLEPRNAACLERHLESCPECRAVLEDFREIRETARRLEIPPVPAAAWNKIDAALREEMRPAARRAFPGFRRFVPAAAALLILAGSAIFFVLLHGPEENRKSARKDERYTISRLDEAERIYEQADRALTEAVAGRRADIDPRIAEMFERNIEAVDGILRIYRQTARLSPGDFKVRGYLLDAYREKIVLLNDFLET